MDRNAYLIELSESDRTAFGRVDFAAQPLEQRIFSAVWALESEVNSGGFSQFFGNEEPELVAFAPAALRSIGAVACAGIVERAVALASSGVIGAESQMEELDSEFLAYPDNLTELLHAHVAAHPTAFREAPAGA